MSLSVHVDRATADQAIATGVVFVPVPMVLGDGDFSDLDNWPKEVPDPVWVQAAEPCPTCGGEGSVGVDFGDGAISGWQDCIDCIAGKPRITITTDCSDARHETHPVTVAYGTIEHGPLPIRRMEGDQGNPLPAILVGIDSHLGHVWGTFVWTDATQVPVDIGPDPESLVGSYGAILEVSAT